MNNKIKGMYYGLALGDSLGAPHEFRNQKKDNYTGKLEIVPRFVNRFSSKTLSVGQYTDDTIMTLALLHSMEKGSMKKDSMEKGYSVNEAILHYEEFARTTSQLGKNTRELFHGVKTIKGYLTRFNKKFDSIEKKNSALSNGALMRCSPLYNSSKEIIIQDCNLTNPNKLCNDCNIFYLSLIKKIISFEGIIGKEEVEKIIEEVIEDSFEKELLNIIEETKSKEISKELREQIKGKQKGYVIIPIFCAIWSLRHFDNFESAIDAIIRLEGDCDTNGAISGALLGAYFGFDKLKTENKTSFNIEVIDNLTFENSDIKLPDKYNFSKVMKEMFD